MQLVAGAKSSLAKIMTLPIIKFLATSLTPIIIIKSQYIIIKNWKYHLKTALQDCRVRVRSLNLSRECVNSVRHLSRQSSSVKIKLSQRNNITQQRNAISQKMSSSSVQDSSIKLPSVPKTSPNEDKSSGASNIHLRSLASSSLPDSRNLSIAGETLLKVSWI